MTHIRLLEFFQGEAPNILYANMYRCNPFIARFSISKDYGFSENEWFSRKTTAPNESARSARKKLCDWLEDDRYQK